MVNLENPHTDYRTGAEYHVDAMINRYHTSNLDMGKHGYVYQQLDTDTIGGVRVADTRSASIGVGRLLLWSPKGAGGDRKVVLKWLHDLDSTRRFEGDILSVTGALHF